MTPTPEAATFAIVATCLAFAAVHLILWHKYRRIRRFIADSKTTHPPPKPGDWIRFLVAQPELEVEIGDRGQIREVVIKDDIGYIVRIDTRSGRTLYATFIEHEAWMFEVIR
jgi:hypothetical protein